MEPSRSGDGLPTARKIRFRSLSYDGVIQTPPPPRCQASAFLALSDRSCVMLRCRSLPAGVVVTHLPHHPFGAIGSKVGSPCGAGMLYQRHICRPVAASYAVTCPRIPYSPPETPTITMFPM